MYSNTVSFGACGKSLWISLLQRETIIMRQLLDYQWEKTLKIRKIRRQFLENEGKFTDLFFIVVFLTPIDGKISPVLCSVIIRNAENQWSAYLCTTKRKRSPTLHNPSTSIISRHYRCLINQTMWGLYSIILYHIIYTKDT